LDRTGTYTKEAFSKPPLSFLLVAASFKAFGASIESLRFPFTLATLLLAVVMYLWGRDLVQSKRTGRWLGFAWGLSFLLSTATLRWGRYAVIEDVLVLFLVSALWFHWRALRRHSAWALAAGAALTLAFFTKQLAVGLAILPMCCAELFSLRAHGLKRVSQRVAMWMLPCIVGAGVWIKLAYARAGTRFVRMLWDFAIEQRFKGYSGTQHFNSLNRVAGVMNEVCHPFSWQLGLLGFALFLLGRKRTRAADGAGLLLPCYLLTTVAIIENTTRSVLPWYSLSILPPLFLGLGWIAVAGFRTLALRWRGKRGGGATYDGLLALCMFGSYQAINESLDGNFSQLNGAILLIAFALALLAAKRWPAVAKGTFVPRLTGITIVALLLLTRASNAEYHQTQGALEGAMGALTRAGSKHPAISRRIKGLYPDSYDPITLFGLDGRIAEEPWRAGAQGTYDAFLAFTTAPSELLKSGKVSALTLPGATLWLGDVSHDPAPPELLAAYLDKRPLTFEAEAMNGDRSDAIARYRSASGGRVRRYDPWLSQGTRSTMVTSGLMLPLPEGSYSVVSWIKWDCGAQPRPKIGYISIGSNTKQLACPPPSEDFVPVAINQNVRPGETLSVKLRFEHGRGSVWHDRTEVWRASSWKEHGAAAGASTKKKSKKKNKNKNKNKSKSRQSPDQPSPAPRPTIKKQADSALDVDASTK
jgi:4-amino-4-deoxy-L-arabinose transferase-like glycosyltransferase